MGDLKQALTLEDNAELNEVKLSLPDGMTKTTYVSHLIANVLEKKGVPMQHKLILKSLEKAIDSSTGKRMFTAGHINSGFNVINKNLSDFNIIKYRQGNGVYYEYTEDPNLLRLNDEKMHNNEQLIDALKQAFEIANNLKLESLTNKIKLEVNMLELIEKLSEVELFLLKNPVNHSEES